MRQPVRRSAQAQKTLEYYGARVTQAALGFGSVLNALDFAQPGTREIFIAGDPGDAATRALVEAVWRNPDPNRVLAVVTPGLEKLLPPAAGKTMVDGKPAAYVCRNFACEAPTTDPARPPSGSTSASASPGCSTPVSRWGSSPASSGSPSGSSATRCAQPTTECPIASPGSSDTAWLAMSMARRAVASGSASRW